MEAFVFVVILICVLIKQKIFAKKNINYYLAS